MGVGAVAVEAAMEAEDMVAGVPAPATAATDILTNRPAESKLADRPSKEQAAASQGGHSRFLKTRTKMPGRQW
jgi:hypothetical protein